MYQRIVFLITIIHRCDQMIAIDHIDCDQSQLIKVLLDQHITFIFAPTEHTHRHTHMYFYPAYCSKISSLVFSYVCCGIK